MKKEENIIPDEYWSTLTEAEKEGMAKAMDESELFLMNEQEWTELDEDYYTQLRVRFNKGPDEIGPREFKSFKSVNLPLWMLVIPSGRQKDGDTYIQYFHTICEDMEDTNCNGSYEMVTEEELESKFNIKYNN